MTHFSDDTFAFLSELADNNNRDWFQRQKPRYERVVKEPAIRFILDFGPHLRAISPNFKADPRSNGGSLFRIYRDTRFSKDKSPYKTHTGIQFRHDAGKDAHAPGFYLHIEPGNCFVGIGSWRPGGSALRKIREGLVEDPEGWREATENDAFRKHFRLSGESLKGGPRGFDPDHPLVEDLKRKDYVAVADLSDQALLESGFLEEYAALCRAGAPFVSFLCHSMELPF